MKQIPPSKNPSLFTDVRGSTTHLPHIVSRLLHSLLHSTAAARLEVLSPPGNIVGCYFPALQRFGRGVNAFLARSVTVSSSMDVNRRSIFAESLIVRPGCRKDDFVRHSSTTSSKTLPVSSTVYEAVPALSWTLF